MTSFMDGPGALFHNRLPKTGGKNFRQALRIAELLLIGRHDGFHINGPSNTLAQAANSTIFQEMAPLLMCTYSTMEGCPLHMVSAMKMALKF